ncbi:MAG: hypothetical protein HYY24_30160 [Verrucomicrobia bacterium]|nr:hypothetical protein [Verrucomicrobiota bacterium]
MTSAELHPFYEGLVRRIHASGGLCAITSGLACVHFDVAETTKDCDLLCHPTAFRQLLELLATTQVEGFTCRYRGNLSPPLDDRWHRGGWTSHFEWGRGPEAVTLDVFGRALRGSAPWEDELAGLYVNPHIVCEMKRTNRDKDWSFITALGMRMVRTGDDRGWLHIFHSAAFEDLLRDHACPAEMVRLRPALELAVQRDPRVDGALNAERKLWEKLDDLRIRIYERPLRVYMVAVRKARIPEAAPLREQHETRVQCALDHLPMAPLGDYGVERHVEEARRWLVESGTVPGDALQWLPDVSRNFSYLTP